MRDFDPHLRMCPPQGPTYVQRKKTSLMMEWFDDSGGSRGLSPPPLPPVASAEDPCFHPSSFNPLDRFPPLDQSSVELGLVVKGLCCLSFAINVDPTL
ncbi:hypothetical protein V6N13_037630 [Hibiscus sabdariffa]